MSCNGALQSAEPETPKSTPLKFHHAENKEWTLIMKIALCGAKRDIWLHEPVVVDLLIAMICLITSEVSYDEYRPSSTFKP
jgi:hypothetical protein